MELMNLIALPDEVLLCILNCLDKWDRQAALFNLFLVNRRFAAFAGIELYYSPTITPARAHLLVVRILETPALASKIARLSIQCTGAEEERLLNWEPNNWESRMAMGNSAAENTREARRRCMAVLRTHGYVDDYTQWITGPGMNGTFVDIAALILLTSNVRCLTLAYQVASDMARPMGLHESGMSRYASHILTEMLPRLVQLRIRPRKLRVRLENHQPLPSLKHPVLGQQFEGYDGDIDALRECLRIPKAELEAENNGPLNLKARIVGRDDDLRLEHLNIGSMIAIKHFEIPSHALFTRPSKSGSSTPLAFPPNMQSLRITACAWNIIQYLDRFATTECSSYVHLRTIEAVWEDYVVRKESVPSAETAQAEMQRVVAAFKEHNVDMVWTFLRGCISEGGDLPMKLFSVRRRLRA
ncbi:hypothetical protein FB567DRAFT_539470 [Paraphoma chrysanthemicola]|uniref:F-box domain-containing protein n=1 Tax=Paraphoma chrysanthemicola TaxID=798071 RepID=A0A8K0VRY8_9PLEO|nr:hypothetical protein FB567DRAFT_539470 [Paraphoma chrysanthemicola]